MDLTNVCRTCLRLPKRAINLFRNNEAILEKIKLISSVEIQNLNGLSRIVCEECLKNINYCFNFHKTIINTNDDLHSRLETLQQTKYSTKSRTNAKNNKPEPKFKLPTVLTVNQDIKKESMEQVNSAADPTQQASKVRTETRYKTERVTKITGQKYKRTFECIECNRQFISQRQKYNHNTIYHHPKVVCPTCGLIMIKSNLRLHLVTHSNETSACNLCDKVCKNSEALRHHVSRYHREKKHPCEICGLKFSVISLLRRHMEKHNDTGYKRKKPCQICGIEVNSLKRHMQTHTGERPYICTYCGKGLSGPYALKIHIRQHTNERPYVCEHCGSAFPQTVSLRTHLKSKHGIPS